MRFLLPSSVFLAAAAGFFLGFAAGLFELLFCPLFSEADLEVCANHITRRL
jgi:hypothetical protein